MKSRIESIFSLICSVSIANQTPDTSAHTTKPSVRNMFRTLYVYHMFGLGRMKNVNAKNQGIQQNTSY